MITSSNGSDVRCDSGNPCLTSGVVMLRGSDAGPNPILQECRSRSGRRLLSCASVHSCHVYPRATDGQVGERQREELKAPVSTKGLGNA